MIVPKGFFPQQDTGMIIGQIRGRPEQFVPGDAASGSEQFAEIVGEDPDVANVHGFAGGGSRDQASMPAACS